jgi:sn-glycerol 3-phosphate transport system ATP-binding protein
MPGGINAIIEAIEYLGADSLVATMPENPHVSRLAPRALLVRMSGRTHLNIGDSVHVAWDSRHEHHFDAQTGGRKP